MNMLGKSSHGLGTPALERHTPAAALINEANALLRVQVQLQLTVVLPCLQEREPNADGQVDSAQ